MSENQNKNTNISIEISPKLKSKPGKKPGSDKSPGSGRQKGTPNKNKLGFEDRLESLGFDVAQEMYALYKETQDINTKLRIIELALRHAVAIPKAVDSSGSSTEKIEINYIQDK